MEDVQTFQTSLSCAHQAMHKFSDQLTKELALQHFIIIQMSWNGASVRYRCFDACVKDYVAMKSAMNFLHAIASSLAVQF